MNSAQFIQLHLKKKQEANSRYSLRALARDLGLSPSFLSRVLSGKKQFPPSRVSRLATVLQLDTSSAQAFKRILAFNQIKDPEVAKQFKNRLRGDRLMDRYHPMGRKKFKLLQHWYTLALLDLSTCSDFDSDPKWIAARLGLTVREVTESMDHLIASGLATNKKGRFNKVNKKIWFGPSQSLSEIRNYHQMMLEKALQVLQWQTLPHEYSNRTISAVSVAVNPKNIERAKSRFESAMREVAAILSEGDCTEVFQVQIQMFPLTKGARD